MAKRPCARPGCAKLVQKGYCEDCAPKHSARARSEAARVRGESKRWYDSARWRATRLGWFRVRPFCADPFGVHGVRLVAATVLDHIVPHKEVFEAFWDSGNWQGLCKACHDRKTATQNGGFGR